MSITISESNFNTLFFDLTMCVTTHGTKT